MLKELVLREFKRYGIEPNKVYLLSDFCDYETEIKELFRAAITAKINIWVNNIETKFHIEA